MSVGRNEPCPCGSGRKYKHCHYAADRASGVAGSPTEKSPLHEVDNRIVEQIVIAISERFPIEAEEAMSALESWDVPLELAVPWLAWIEEFDGRTAAEWYVEARGWSLATSVAEWIESQRKASLSIWQVRDVVPGNLTLVDQLTGDERTIHDVMLSASIEVETYILARIVDHRGLSLAAGMHPQVLRPMQAAPVVETIKRMMRRKRDVPRERLRNAKAAWRMLTEWTHAIERHSRPPQLRTSDGDEILVTTERWSFDPADRDAVIERLTTLPDAIVYPEDGPPEEIAFVRESDDTLVAKLDLGDGGFAVDTISLTRADEIRERIEQACGDLIRRGLRTHEDPTSTFDAVMANRGREKHHSDESDDEGNPEHAAFVREYKTRHYAAWIDDSIPALDGQTPREAARTAAGRRKLIPLLDGLAMMENTLPANQRFDVSALSTELGIKRK